MPKHLPTNKKTQVLSLLVEGNSIRSIERITGVHRDTILRVLNEAGTRARDILDSQVVNLECGFIQADEIWCYCKKKQSNCTPTEKDKPDFGDQYVFVALDPETKLVVSFFVGKRNGQSTRSFLSDLRGRISTRFQLSTDSFTAYVNAVDDVFGIDIDYGMIHKEYEDETRTERRYSPPKIVSVKISSITGSPIYSRISTSLVERQNLTMRMNMRRFTRLTNAFSKNLDNLKSAVALHFWHYNFVRLHQTLRITPAMEAKVTSHIWSFEELLNNRQLEKAA
jgi:IS1 family transposase